MTRNSLIPGKCALYEAVKKLFVVQCSMFNCRLSSGVTLRAVFSYRCRAEGVSENDKRQSNIETTNDFFTAS
jgi:hypothetical protein